MTMKPKISGKILVAFCILVIALIAFILFSPTYSATEVCFNAPAGSEAAECIRADVVDDELSRELGLSGRSSLSEDAGMLFVFEKESRYGFWMKGMLIPLDIIWLNKDKRVIFVERDLPPCTDSYCPGHGPQTTSLYVIEVAANYTIRHNISNGTGVFFNLAK
jgi:uncharacterized membrane protein (UPF0127 family)